ncbi:hypothetical protein TPELB_09640 [Terrisporobacter petrolearius]|uniref:Capsular polysaccharide synthesis protein n=1 Tax=Terrisporobacter petrolearius TaxID=1460447 RepID=A0ABZ3FBB8_9FIRM
MGNSLYDKLKKRIAMIKIDLINDINYYPKLLLIIRFINNCTFKGKLLKSLNQWSLQKKHKLIMDYLEKEYNHIFEKFKEEKDIEETINDLPIWVCWLQGEENAPKLVKNCIRSIRRHSKNHKVILITQNNYSNYIDIPQYIVEKFNSKKISSAHFSDIIRMMLIRDYGGLWLDATVYCKTDIPEEILNSSLFSCKSIRQKSNYISEYQWTSFILGGRKNGLFYRFMVDFYLEYWKKEEVAIDYLFMDYVVVLARKNIKEIDAQIENIPINNLDRDYLAVIFNNKFQDKEYKEFISNDTYFYKLSWREKFKYISDDGGKTFYYVFLNEFDKYFDL